MPRNGKSKTWYDKLTVHKVSLILISAISILAVMLFYLKFLVNNNLDHFSGVPGWFHSMIVENVPRKVNQIKH